MALIQPWQPFFRRRVRMQGQALQLAEKVKSQPAANGERVRTEVADDEGKHTVTIDQEDSGHAAAQCTCAQFAAGVFCPHIWATVLAIDRDQAGDSDASQALADLKPRAPRARKRAGASKASQRTQRNAEPPWVSRLTLLRAGSSAVEGEQTPAQPVLPVQRQIGYVILCKSSEQMSALVIEVQQRQATATGWSKPKALRLSRQTISELPDPIDRQLCGLLLGAMPIGDQSSSAPGTPAAGPRSKAGFGESRFRLPSGTGLGLLGQAIDAGRCYYDPQRDSEDESDWGSLTWEPAPDNQDIERFNHHSNASSSTDIGQTNPAETDNAHDWPTAETASEDAPDTQAPGSALAGDWELANSPEPYRPWLVGHETGDELILDLELRRGGQRISIDRPVLVIPGSDGLVINAQADADAAQTGFAAVASPFDDCEATRWVSQFRDPPAQRGADRSAPSSDESPDRLIRVPNHDVRRFIDRLFWLDQLPELDLPPHLQPTEADSNAQPRPRLDLFHDAQAAGVDVPANTARQHLIGRLWFDYATRAVNPTEIGQFVTANPTPSASSDSESTEADANEDDSTTKDATDQDHGQPGADEPSDQTSVDPAEEPAFANDQTSVAGEESEEGESAHLIRRKRRFEQDAISLLARLGARQAPTEALNTLLLAERQAPQTIAELLGRGWEVSADRQPVRGGAAPRLSISSDIDWFELRGQVAYQRADGTTQEVSLPEILKAAKSGRRMIQLDDGSQGLLPEQWLAEHGLLTGLGKVKDDALRFSRSQAMLLDAMLEQTDPQRITFDQTFADIRKRIGEFTGIQPLEPPADFQGSLRPYQKDGLGWLEFLRWLGTGGVLADDMGLGKTIQVLAMIQDQVKQRHEAAKPRRHEGDGDSGRPASAGPGATSDQATKRRSGEEAEGEESDEGTEGRRDGETQEATPLAAGSSHSPSLIVVPRSVVFNWTDEAQRFTPDLKVLVYLGSERAGLRQQFNDHDVIITSYGLLRRDIEELSKFEFEYAVLDEAQAIKNPDSQSAKATRLIQAQHRLALTGTPVENHLGDLWSIFEFLNPGMLGPSTRFGKLAREASSPQNASKSNTQSSTDANKAPQPQAAPSRSPLSRLAGALRPFILRRTKHQVLRDLPEKTEQTIVCEMSSAQRKVYNQLRDYYRGSLLNRLDETQTAGQTSAVGQNSFMVLEALLRLRQTACHPALVNKRPSEDEGAQELPPPQPTDQSKKGEPSETEESGTFDQSPNHQTSKSPNHQIAKRPKSSASQSAKLDTLEDYLSELIDEGSKALVFSQFTSMLGLVRERLDHLGIQYAYLDGRTRNRKEQVQRFQTDPEVSVFLVSLKAGGTGLNLTAAEYVFLLDPWWNPAVERQAIDRTHRIGQTRPVFAYRLVCQDTVEQRIIELQNQKRELAEAIVEGEQNVMQTLTRDDLDKLLT